MKGKSMKNIEIINVDSIKDIKINDKILIRKNILFNNIFGIKNLFNIFYDEQKLLLKKYYNITFRIKNINKNSVDLSANIYITTEMLKLLNYLYNKSIKWSKNKESDMIYIYDLKLFEIVKFKLSQE